MNDILCLSYTLCITLRFAFLLQDLYRSLWQSASIGYNPATGMPHRKASCSAHCSHMRDRFSLLHDHPVTYCGSLYQIQSRGDEDTGYAFLVPFWCRSLFSLLCLPILRFCSVRFATSHMDLTLHWSVAHGIVCSFPHFSVRRFLSLTEVNARKQTVIVACSSTIPASVFVLSFCLQFASSVLFAANTLCSCVLRFPLSLVLPFHSFSCVSFHSFSFDSVFFYSLSSASIYSLSSILLSHFRHDPSPDGNTRRQTAHASSLFSASPLPLHSPHGSHHSPLSPPLPSPVRLG